jgi:hypothetical protein
MTIRLRRSLPALAVLAILGMAACGKSDPPPATSGPAITSGNPAGSSSPAAGTSAAGAIDPCTLVTMQEAAVLAGTPVDPAERVRDTCTYTAPVTGPTGQVEVYVGDGAKKTLDIDRELSHDFTALPGVGDEAWLEEGNAFVRKGTIWVSVRLVRLNDPAENRQPLTDLITKVATRL